MARTVLLAVMLLQGVAYGQESAGAHKQPAGQADLTGRPDPRLSGDAPPLGDGQDDVSFRFLIGGGYAAPADFEDLGDVSITRSAAELSIDIPLVAEELSLSIGLLNEWSWYNFDTGFADREVTLFRASTGLQWKIDEKWSAVGGIDVEAAAETDADFSDGMTFGGFAGARYEISPTLALTFGVFGRTQIEDNVMVLPLIGIDWQFAEDWTFSIQGPSARVSYSVSEELELSLRASMDNRAFRLNDDPGKYKEAVLRDERVTVGLQAQWEPKPWFSLNAEAGMVVMSEIQFDDAEGNRISKDDGDPAAYFGLSATFRF